VVAGRVLKTMLGSLAQGCCDGGMGRRQGNICSVNVGRPPKRATAAVDGQFTSQKRFEEGKRSRKRICI
jgi:hypothetical protein